MDIVQKVWKHDLFINENKPCIINQEIIEYDMKEAGFSLTRQFGLLPDDKIKWLEKIGKERRKIVLGNMQNSEKGFREALKVAFQDARELFFLANKLEKNDIVSIKKDAIFSRKRCPEQKFGDYIDFRIKNYYSSYINMGNNLEFYYNPNQLDIKGLNDENYKKHEKYMISFIKSYFKKAENSSGNITRIFLRHFIDKYKRREVDIGYYRTFDHRSMYELLDEDVLYDNYFEEDKENVDITFNYFRLLVKLAKVPIK